jgi:hypothetical protein
MTHDAAASSYRGLYAYAWDLAEEGFGAVADRARAAGLDTVTLAAAYHAGKFLRPRGRGGKVFFPEDGTVYFPARPERYGRVRPLPNSLLERLDPFAELVREAPDLGRVGWVVCCHNTALGRLHPDLVSRNCFGDGYVYSLCPAHPEVREYVVALCADLADRHELKALALETPGWLPYDHGYHHEFAMAPLDERARVLLGLCFAPASVEGAAAAGIDAEALRRETCRRLEAWLASDVVLTERRAADALLADLALEPDWGAFVRWRCACVADLVREVRAAVPRGTEVWVIPSVQRPTARGWVEGSDLRLLAGAADRIEVCAYEPSAAEVAADIADARERAGPRARLNAILRPHHPDLAGGAEAAAAARALRAAGCEGVAFYNYGHWRPGALDRVREALAAWDVAE